MMVYTERLERSYLGSLLRLTLLAPDFIEAILDGRQPDGITLPQLLEPLLTCWTTQRVLFRQLLLVATRARQ